MTDLQRITVKYMDFEDRFRLTGELRADKGENPEAEATDRVEVVTIWLTQRLFNLLLPVLLDWVQEQSPEATKNPSRDRQANNMLQGFAQQAATEQIPQQAPVESKVDSRSWLVREVDVDKTPQWIRLAFRGHDGEEASFALEGHQLRQWLSIVFSNWIKAEWPMGIWPSWIQESAGGSEAASDRPFH